MSTTITINANRSAMVDEGHPTTNYSTGTVAVLGEAGYVQYRGLLVGFPAGATAENQYKRIRSASLRAYLTPTLYAYANFYAHTLLASWAEGSVTFATRPSAGGGALGPSDYAFAAGYVGVALSRAELASVQSFGVLCDNSIYAYSGMFGPAIDTSRSSSPPQLLLDLEDDDAVPDLTGSPAGGYVNKHTDITLFWQSSTPWTLTEITQTSAVLSWREGSAGEIHTVDLTTAAAYELPADSVSGPELRWQVAVTYNSGAVVTTPWYVCSTVEALSTAEIVRPKDTLVDGSGAVELRWDHVISTGSAQNGADLQISSDGSTWADLAAVRAGACVMRFGVTSARLSRLFRAVVYDADGNSRASSGVPVVASAPPIVITAQPQDYVGQLGEDAVFTVTATGTGLSYQWQVFVPGTGWINSGSTGNKTPTLTLEITALRQRYTYRCKITDSGSNVLLSNTAIMRTAAPPIIITAEPEAFVGGVGDLASFSVAATGTGLRFVWQESADNGETWTDSAELADAVSEAMIPANTLPAGTVFWRVRTYNTDDAPGAWSEPAQISVVAGPGVPVAACTSAPRPVISWQVSGQQGFEAEIGGQSSGVVYGTGKSWQPPEYLPDGQFTARVRVVNSYGLWSDWGEVGVSITNPGAGAAFAVSAYANVDVLLAWAAVAGAAEYWIYRNGVKIGETSEPQYTDRWSNGFAVWQVRAILGEGYRDSAEVSASVQLRFPVISALDGDWIELRYSTEPVPTVQRVSGRDVALLRVQGAAYPVAESAPYKTRTYALTAAFPRSAGPAAFESLLGREVMLKDQYGAVIHGVIASITTTANRFFFVCSAQLQEVDGVK